jgi:Uma2 family endonuclease
MVVATPPVLTVEEFFKLHGGESNVDLVRGQVVRYPMAGIRHGVVCLNAGAVLREFVRAHELGRVMGNDTFVRISPETCRGADVCFVGYGKLPPGVSPDGVLEVPPDLVIEVRSPSDLWTDALAKMLDYIRIGVPVVVILDPKTESASVFRPGDRQETFEKDQTLSIPDVLPGFTVPVARFFEE